MQANILTIGQSMAGHVLGVLLSLALITSPAAAQAEVAETYFKKSYALLIGNDTYSNGWPHLQNGIADAEAMAAELARHGFHTIVKRNLARRDLREALEKFFIEAGSDPEARLIVWFSGHGHTVNGEGYLVPSGAPGPDDDVRFRQGAVSVREFGRLMREARAR
ncbi:MAG: caspase family protein, partial [Pseudomonadota bacterium]